MQIRTFAELTTADDRTLRFTPLGLATEGKLSPEDAAEFQQGRRHLILILRWSNIFCPAAAAVATAEAEAPRSVGAHLRDWVTIKHGTALRRHWGRHHQQRHERTSNGAHGCTASVTPLLGDGGHVLEPRRVTLPPEGSLNQ